MAAIIDPAADEIPDDTIAEVYGALAPGGFLVVVLNEAHDHRALVRACGENGFPIVRAMPLIASGDATFVHAAVTAHREAEPAATAERTQAVHAAIVEELATRAAETHRRAYADFLPAVWRLVVALKPAPRLVVPRMVAPPASA